VLFVLALQSTVAQVPPANACLAEFEQLFAWDDAGGGYDSARAAFLPNGIANDPGVGALYAGKSRVIVSGNDGVATHEVSGWVIQPDVAAAVGERCC
jgi:hypothetical protein